MFNTKKIIPMLKTLVSNTAFSRNQLTFAFETQLKVAAHSFPKSSVNVNHEPDRDKGKVST